MHQPMQGARRQTEAENGSDFDQPFNCAKCGHLACVCNIQKNHKPGCNFRVAATSPVGIECEHGRDVCPICDACDCGEK